MISDIGSLAVPALHKQTTFAVLCSILILLGSCSGRADRLDELVQKFPQQRDDLNEARGLIQSLTASEGILGLMVGARYNETPDKVWLRHNSPPVPVQTITLKNSASKSRLDRLSVIANKLSCEVVALDEFGQVRVIMYSGKNYDYGYEFFARSGTRTEKAGNYVVIPGEEKWLAFRR